MNRIVLASSNKGKLAEINHLLEPLSIEAVAQSAFDIPDADETGLSFIENAILKARHAASLSGLPALADDSGLEVDALNGAPGIYSARFSGEGATDEENNKLLVEKLSALPEQKFTARYHCVLAFMRHEADPVPLVCQGSWEGEIILSPRGQQGFGYDPHFLIPELGKTAAELDKEEKSLLSHRGIALKLFINALEK